MKPPRFASLLLFDLKYSMMRNRIRLLLLPIMPIGSSLWCHSYIRFLIGQGFRVEPTLGDYLFFEFSGISFYMPQTDIQLPFIWLLLTIYLLFLTADYLVESMKKYGLQGLIRSGRVEHWWLEKCCLAVMTVFAYIAFMVVLTVLYCVYKHVPLSLEVSDRFMTFYYNLDPDSISFLQGRLGLLILSVTLIYTLMTLIQQTLSLFIQPRLAFAVTVGYAYLGIYLSGPAWLSNFTMLLRYAQTGAEEGITIETACLLFGGIFVLCALVGILRMRNMDFIRKEEY